MKNSIKYFPWAPGIPWQARRGKYILPEVPVALLHNIAKKKELVVSGYGGFLESFYSLSILEVLNKEFPSHKLFWIGPNTYHNLLKTNGLAKSSDGVEPNDLARFPTPVFLDKENRVYFNYLNNYIDIKTYYLTSGRVDRRPAIQQIYEKSTLNRDFIIPELRYDDTLNKFTQLFKAHRTDISRPFILFLPDRIKCSHHKEKFLDWNEYQNKSFITLAIRNGWQVIVMTEEKSKYWGTNASVFPFSVDLFFRLAPLARYILSKEVDFPLVSLSISDAKIIANKISGCFNIEKNSNIVGRDSVIYSNDDFSPISALEITQESI